MGRPLAHIRDCEEQERAELLREGIGSFSEEDIAKALATIKAFEAFETPEMTRLRDSLLPEVMRWRREARGIDEPKSIASKAFDYLLHNPGSTPSEVAAAIKEDQNPVNAALTYAFSKGKLTRESDRTFVTGLRIWKYSRIDDIPTPVRPIRQTGLSKKCVAALSSERGLTPAQIAKKIGTTSSQVSNTLIPKAKAGKLSRKEVGKSRSGLTVWEYSPVPDPPLEASARSFGKKYECALPERCAQYIKENPGLTAAQIASASNRSRNRIVEALRDAFKKGSVRREPKSGVGISFRYFPPVEVPVEKKAKKAPWNKGIPMSAEQKLKLSLLEKARRDGCHLAQTRYPNRTMPVRDDLPYPEEANILSALKEALPAWTTFTLECFGGFCPVQGFGKIDGQSWYFRARGQHWSLTIGPEDFECSGYVDDKDAVFDIIGPCNVLKMFAAGYMEDAETIEHMTYALARYLSGERGLIELPDPPDMPKWGPEMELDLNKESSK